MNRGGSEQLEFIVPADHGRGAIDSSQESELVTKVANHIYIIYIYENQGII